MDIFNTVMRYDKVVFLACNNITDDLAMLDTLDIEAKAIDYDPKFGSEHWYECKDFVFDDVIIDGDLTVHYNVEKTYPVKLSGDVILRGDNQQHNGDCCPITSCEQMIDMYNIKEVYEKNEYDGHFFVYGRA